MVDLTNVNGIYLYPDGVDFRKGLTSLSNLVLTEFRKNDALGCLFVFFSNNKRQIRIIQIEEDGTWLYQKKLNNYRFIFPSVENRVIIDKHQLTLILKSIVKIEFKKRKK